MDSSSDTVIDRLKAAIEAAAVYNPNDAVRPAAILWTDSAGLWQAVVPRLRGVIPHLLTLGDYEPSTNTGPAIWLRCIVDGVLDEPTVGSGAVPLLYLPGVGRQALGAAETCPAHLRPLVELQYRGVCWTQKNGKDWTVEAFLASNDGGLGLDVARDAASRQAMSRALSELAATPVSALAGKRLEAEDFDRLLTDDLPRDVLVWLNDPQGTKAAWDAQRWEAFASRCKAALGFHPDGDGAVEAAERLGEREASWDAVWRRFEEAPSLYPNLPRSSTKRCQTCWRSRGRLGRNATTTTKPHCGTGWPIRESCLPPLPAARFWTWSARTPSAGIGLGRDWGSRHWRLLSGTWRWLPNARRASSAASPRKTWRLATPKAHGRWTSPRSTAWRR